MSQEKNPRPEKNFVLGNKKRRTQVEKAYYQYGGPKNKKSATGEMFGRRCRTKRKAGGVFRGSQVLIREEPLTWRW